MNETARRADAERTGAGSVLPVGGRVFYSSDWHLMHERILDLAHRPFGDVREMSLTIIENTNQVVTEADTLVLLGDTLMGRLEGPGGSFELLGQVRAGRLILIPGNHDRWSLAFHHSGDPAARRLTRARWRARYRAAASEGRWGARRGLENVLVVPDRTPSMWQGFVPGGMVNISHYPYRGGGDSLQSAEPGKPDRYADLRGADTGLPLVCGHVHTLWRESLGVGGGRMLNVGVDKWAFQPVPEHVLTQYLHGAAA